MNLKNYRITASGFTFFMFFILTITIIMSICFRSLNSKAQYTYQISNVIDSKYDISIDVDMRTIGDAVLYKPKDINSSNLISFQNRFASFNGNYNDVSYETIITEDKLYLKNLQTSKWTYIQLEQFMKLLTDDSNFNLSKLKEILTSDWEQIEVKSRHLPELFKLIYDKGQIVDNQLIVDIDLDESYHLLDQMLLHLSTDRQFVNFIQEKYSIFYNAFAHEPLLKRYNFNSRKQFAIMVSLNSDFYKTLHNFLEESRKKITHLYKDDSTIQLILSIPSENIELEVSAKLFYKTCDAYEYINLKINFENKNFNNFPKGELEPLNISSN